MSHLTAGMRMPRPTTHIPDLTLRVQHVSPNVAHSTNKAEPTQRKQRLKPGRRVFNGEDLTSRKSPASLSAR